MNAYNVLLLLFQGEKSCEKLRKKDQFFNRYALKKT